MEQMQAIIMACVETKSPVILQVSKGARDYANMNLLRNMAKGATEYAHELGYDIPIVLHLDHGDSFETCKECIDNGFSSVMIDGSALPYDQKTGARGLRSIVEAIMTDIMYDVPSFSDVAKVRIEESTVTKKTRPALIGKNGEPIDIKLLS